MLEIIKLIPRRQDTWLEICTAEESIRLPAGKLPAGLRAGTSVTEREWEELRIEADYWGLHDKAVGILARREHFRRELEVKLGKQCRDRELISSVLDACEDRGYINARRAAELTVQNLLVRGRVGTARIRQELIRKGCPRDILTEVVEAATAGRDELDELNDLLKSREKSLQSRLARSREKLIKKGTPEQRINYELRQQLTAAVVRLLNGRGFVGEVALRAAREKVAELLADDDS